MLFLPWREENKLVGNYNSHADRYHDQMEEIRKIEDLFIHHEQEIDDAFQQLQTVGPPQDCMGQFGTSSRRITTSGTR